MSDKSFDNPLQEAIDQLIKELGLPSRAALWRLADVDSSRWNKLVGVPPRAKVIKADVEGLIGGLAAHGQPLSPEQKERLYQAIGMLVTLSPPSPPAPSPAETEVAPAATKPEPAPAPTPTQAGPSYIQNAPYSQGAIQKNDGTVNQNFVTQAAPRERACPAPPAPPDYFGGRAKEVAELHRRLKQGGTVAITALHGQGGIGKTTLASAVANQLYDDGTFGAVLYARLTRQPDARTWLEAWARHADPLFTWSGVDLETLPGTVKPLLQGLTGQCGGRTLVLLDDVWDNGEAAVGLLRAACPKGTVVLLTTRSQGLALHLKAASPLTLGSLLDPDANKPKAERVAEGVAMLQTYLPEVASEGLGELVLVLGGHPQAMGLAALRVQAKDDPPAVALAAHVKQYRAGLPQGTPFQHLELEEENRDDNLTRALSYSYEELSEVEQGRFRRLGAMAYDQAFSVGLLAAGWEEEAEAVARYCGDKRSGLRSLDLLQPDPAAGQGQGQREAAGADSKAGEKWYRLHPLLHAYARALLKQNAAEYRAATVAYQDGVIGLAGQFDELPPQEWITQGLEAYRPHLLEVGASLTHETGLTFPADGQGEPKFTTAVAPEVAERALAFAENTYLYLANRREVREGGWLWLGLAASQRLAHRGWESEFLNELAHYYSDMGEKLQALALYRPSLAIAKEQGNQKNEATILNNIGAVYAALGDKVKALAYLQQALPIRRAVGDRAGEAATLNNIGMIYNDLGDKAKALAYYEQALPIKRAVGDRAGEANTLNNIGVVYDDSGDKAKALKYYNEALPIKRAVGDRAGEAITLTNIGVVYDDSGDKAKALKYYNEALPILRVVGNRAGEATTLNNIGMFYKDLGDKVKALAYYEQALPIQKAVGDRAGEANTLNNMGILLWGMGQRAEGMGLLERAVALFKAVQSPNAKVVAGYLARMRAELAGGGGAFGLSTLPPEQIEMLVEITIAVRTFAAEKLDELRERLERLRTNWAGKVAEWKIEIEFIEIKFVEALLAVVNGQPAIELPENHPYRPYLARVLEAIKQYEG